MKAKSIRADSDSSTPFMPSFAVFPLPGPDCLGSQYGGLTVLVHTVSRRAGLFDYVGFPAASR